jgi:hypothetical protein
MIEKQFVTITPAYGADYTSAKAAKDAFLFGRDFILQDFESFFDGKPCNLPNFKPGLTVNIRYKKLRSVAVVKVP